MSVCLLSTLSSVCPSVCLSVHKSYCDRWHSITSYLLSFHPFSRAHVCVVVFLSVFPFFRQSVRALDASLPDPAPDKSKIRTLNPHICHKNISKISPNKITRRAERGHKRSEINHLCAMRARNLRFRRKRTGHNPPSGPLRAPDMC